MTKKSVEISGLPVISITEGRELGVSKTLVIDARRGAVAAITIEDEDWYRGVKLLPYSSVIAIGRDALTVTSSQSILTLEEASDFEAMLDANIRILGTKAITKTGTINGKVTEIFINDDDGVVDKVQITRNDGSEFEILSDEISIFGKQVTVIGDPGDGEDRKHIVEEYNVAPSRAPEPEPIADATPQPIAEPTDVALAEPVPTPEPSASVSAEAESLPELETTDLEMPEPSPEMTEAVSMPEAEATEPEMPETAEEPEIIPQPMEALAAAPAPGSEATETPGPEPTDALVLEPTPEPEFLPEAESALAPEPEEESTAKPKRKTSARSKKTAAPEPAEELILDLESEPEPKKKSAAKPKRATTAKAKKPKKAPAPQNPEDAEKAAMERHRRFLIGKKASRDILAGSSAIIAKAGDAITEEVLQKAQLAGKLIELSMNAQ